MVWFRKKPATEAPPSDQSDESAERLDRKVGAPVPKTVSTEKISRSTRDELFHFGELKSVAANDELVTRLQNQEGRLFLLIEVDIEIKTRGLPAKGPVIQKPFLLLTPAILEALGGHLLICRSPGKMLILKVEDMHASTDYLKAHLDAWEAVTEKLVLRAVAEGVSDVIRNHMNLSKTHREHLRKHESDFAQSEVVTTILGKIPRLPVGTMQILAALTDESSTADQITDLVRQDPALTALLLKAVNSPQYSFEQEITDVDRCIVLLGYEGAYQLVMSSSLKKSLPKSPKYQKSYERSIELAQLAFAIAQASGRANSSEMSTLALLSDIGILVSDLVKRQNPKFQDLVAMVEPCKFAGALLKTWALPEVIWRTISLSDNPQHTPPSELADEIRYPLAILHIAHHLHNLKFNTDTNEVALFLEEYLESLGWAGETLESVWESAIVPGLRKRRNTLPVSMREI